MLDPRAGLRCTAGMATLHHPACEWRDLASHPTDTPVFHAVEQKLRASWLFDSRLPVPGMAVRRPTPRRRHAKASHRAQPGGQG